MSNKIHLTDLEQQVLEAFCKLYFRSIMPPTVSRHHISYKCNLSKYKTLKALRGLRDKGLIKFVREYYEGDLEEESFMAIGYKPTAKLERMEVYQRIDKEFKENIREYLETYDK
nr:MAG TPA: winged helix-turn-helix transcription repressor [Caudoviricetes sp.]